MSNDVTDLYDDEKKEEDKPAAASPPTTSAAAEPPIWVVKRYFPAEKLQYVLNRLASEGYQVRDILTASAPEGHRYLQEGTQCFHVIAFDAMRIMKKQGEDMHAQLAALMGNVTQPIPMGPPQR